MSRLYELACRKEKGAVQFASDLVVGFSREKNYMQRTGTAFDLRESEKDITWMSQNMQRALGYFYRAVADVLFRHRGSEAAFWRDVDPEMQLRRSSGIWSEILEGRIKKEEEQDAEERDKVSARRQLKMAEMQSKERLNSSKRRGV